MPLIHPDEVLLNQGEESLSGWSACEHYAGNEKKLRKAFALQQGLDGQFEVTADLEDGAASGEEAHAAQQIAALLSEPRPPGHRAGCRIHPVQSPHFLSDAKTLMDSQARLDYITLPKIAGQEELLFALGHLERLAQQAGRQRSVAVQVLIEDERSLHEVFSIASHPQVAFIAFGQMDFTSSHRGAIGAKAMHSPGQFDHPLMRRAKLEISAACHAHAKIPTHNPTTDYASPTQAQEDALRARHEFGFQRMWSIHPVQISQILAAFQPSPAELGDAQRILLAAQQADWGPIADQGLLHDRASYRYYWGLLKKAKASGRGLSTAAQTAFF